MAYGRIMGLESWEWIVLLRMNRYDLCQWSLWYLIRIYDIGGNFEIYSMKPWQRQTRISNCQLVTDPHISSMQSIFLFALVTIAGKWCWTRIHESSDCTIHVSNVPHKCRGSHQVMRYLLAQLRRRVLTPYQWCGWRQSSLIRVANNQRCQC